MIARVILVVAAGLLLGCSSSSGNDGSTSTLGASSTSGGVEYDPSSKLLVSGRESFVACATVLDESSSESAAVGRLTEALVDASQDEEWPAEFGTPSVDAGCPLSPAALDARTPRFVDRVLCRRDVSKYLVFVFIADEAVFRERFPTTPADGVRIAPEESISQDGATCFGDVSVGWYLTPAELANNDVLNRYIYFEPEAL